MEIAKRDGSILVVEDEREIRDFFVLSLQCHGHRVHSVENGEEALRFLEHQADRVSAILLDVVMPRKDGLTTLRRLRGAYPDVPVVVVSGASSTATVVEAMKSGAADFLVKPLEDADLAVAVQNVINSSPRPRPSSAPSPAGSSPATQQEGFVLGSWVNKIGSFLDSIAACDAPVLIQGETGSGKEVIAQLIHAKSARRNRPFLKLNCAALPSELVESELFGFEKGAFTGAFKNKPGKFDLANTGTLMLDEIGDMDFKLQAKLLQVLQDQTFERLGGSATVKVDVRIIAATHCDLDRSIAANKFREDLYHRLNVVGIHVPPLRERQEEILPLSELFLRKYKTQSAPHLELPSMLRTALLGYHWPGNVRELENFMRRYLVLRNPQLAVEELQSRARKKGVAVVMETAAPAPAAPKQMPNSLTKVNEVQRQLETDAIMVALNKTHWNRKQAAVLLGIDYKALLYKMKKFGIDNPDLGDDLGAESMHGPTTTLQPVGGISHEEVLLRRRA